MNFIALAFKGRPDAWRYILGFFFILGFWQILGSLPLLYLFFRNVELDQIASTDIYSLIELLGTNTFYVLTLISFVFGWVGLLFYLRLVHRQSLLHCTTTRDRVDWGRIFFAFFLTAVLLVVYLAVSVYLDPEAYQWNFDPVAFAILAGISLLLLPIQTSFEEYFFRGYLMQGIGSMTRSSFVALLTTSILFGSLHILNPEIEKIGYSMLIIYIGMGLMLGMITLMDEGLELALGYHAANNLTIALLVTSDWSALRVDSVYKSLAEPNFPEMLFSFLISTTILLTVFAVRYKWKNWGSKLFGRVSEPVATPAKQEA